MMILVCLSLMFGFTACEKKKTAVLDDKAVNQTEFVVENLISMDRQDMFTNYGKVYRWYETCIVLDEFMDEECDGSIKGVSNVFQTIEEFEEGKSFDTHVVMFTHTPDTTAVEVKWGFWVEDFPLNDEVIKVTFKEAFDKVMATNYPKPHSQHVVLRKEIGPNDANPQYIFGNSHAQIYVDAVTGEVSDKNPVFPSDVQLKKPLGEWP